jgi:hypothetical protein
VLARSLANADQLWRSAGMAGSCAERDTESIRDDGSGQSRYHADMVRTIRTVVPDTRAYFSIFLLVPCAG